MYNLPSPYSRSKKEISVCSIQVPGRTHASKLLDQVFGAGKKFRPRNRYDHETDDSKSYLVGIAMDFHRHRFWLSFWNTTRHS